MELKLQSYIDTQRNKVGFNRTFMELKCPSTRFSVTVLRGFNRTFMELKFCNL